MHVTRGSSPYLTPAAPVQPEPDVLVRRAPRGDVRAFFMGVDVMLIAAVGGFVSCVLFLLMR